MKVSQGIHYWLEYHKLHSKKKHPQNLPVDPFQINRSIRWKGSKLPDPRRGPLFPHRLQPRDQTVNQTYPVLPTHFLLQLHHPKPRPQFPKLLWYPNAQKAVSFTRTHSLEDKIPSDIHTMNYFFSLHISTADLQGMINRTVSVSLTIRRRTGWNS